MPTLDSFLSRWQNATGTERANHQLFIAELCELLDLPRPDPATDDNDQNAYVFERRVAFHNPDGTQNRGYIDCYRRGCFILEAKSTGKAFASGKWDDAMLRAHGQAVAYARALPKTEGRPPFVITLDVGVALEIYSEFTRSGGAYIPYPDPRSHRIRLEDLRDPNIRERLRAIWLEPLALDPTRLSAKVTRDIAGRLAKLAKSLEQSGELSKQVGPAQVANFLMRAIFTMFAEDVGLIENRAFTELLESLEQTPEQFAPMVEELWQKMNSGGFSTTIRRKLLQFNGGLFADSSALALDKQQIALLIDAARADWRNVEPAIFGTLLERALDPRERHKLGAHYTPRAYVERLVMPTVINPLREEWDNTKATALIHDRQGKHKEAVKAIQAFHIRLCQLRILDPACGSGNFLYVTLEHLKRLEGEVFNILEQLGETQQLMEMQGITVDPHQFLGIETNPRAAAIAEAVIWIGYLQWHFRTKGDIDPPEPVLREFKNIQNRDAVLQWERIETETDENGEPVTRWDGRTTRTHPVTGEPVPDEAARVAVERYIAPKKAQWPEADYVVGNPPFIGNKRMRTALGDGYVEALRNTYPRMPESADLVMYWWHQAADLIRAGKLRRFGLITTNSLRQNFNRRVIQHHMDQKKPISLRYAVPDHPWVDSADGAAVRIAMTVAEAGELPGILETVMAEKDAGGEGREVETKRRAGKLFADLKVGVDVAGCSPLQANIGLSSRGMIPHGGGFLVTPEQGATLDDGALLRPYRNGMDLANRPRGVFVIDTFGLTEAELRQHYPATWQWLHERVKPDRDQNPRKSRRENWWLFGENQPRMRASVAELPLYAATIQTSKHRFFVSLESEILPDDKLIAVGLEDMYFLGILSSRLHVMWALLSGSRLGVGNDPVYNKSSCFDAFPFPDATPDQKQRIRDLAQQIDHHRKRQQQQHPDLTLTGIYNVLEKLRKIDAGTGREVALCPGEQRSNDANQAGNEINQAGNEAFEIRNETNQAGNEAFEARNEANQARNDTDVIGNDANEASNPAPEAAPAEPETLTAKEKTIHEQGLVSLLRQLHDELDRAVFEAYGWGDLADRLVGRPGATTPWPEKPDDQTQAEEELLQRLVDLNHQRAAEEQRGIIRWLRPEYQNPTHAITDAGATATQEEAPLDASTTPVEITTAKTPWPKTIPEQVQAIRAALHQHPEPATAEQLARTFKGAQVKRVSEILDTLVAMGQAREEGGRYAGV